MGFRFRKSFGKGPFRITVSKSGVGYSVGTKGFRYTKKAGGGTRTTASIPGTGISYVKDSGSKTTAPKTVPAKPISSNTSPVKPIVSDPDTISTANSEPVSSCVISRHKYCSKCKKEIPLDAKSCPHCGKRWGGNHSGVPSRAWYLVPASLAILAIILAHTGAEEPPVPIQQIATIATEATTEQAEPATRETTAVAVPTADPFAGQGSAGADKQTSYILNTSTHKFHYPDCDDVDKMNPSNKKSFIGSRDEAISQGYDPCGHCDP